MSGTCVFSALYLVLTVQVKMELISILTCTVDVVSSEIQRFAQKHEGRLHHHEKVEAIHLLDSTCIVRRLQNT